MNKKFRKACASLLAFVLAFGMMLPTNNPGIVKAAEDSQVLNVSEMTAGNISETTSYGYFSVSATADKGVSIDANNKTGDNGMAFTQRLKLGGSGSLEARNVFFNTKGAATVTVYALSSSSSADRNLLLMDSTGAELGRGVAYGKPADNIIPAITYEISDAGQYFLLSEASGINIYYVEVKEAATAGGKAMYFNASELPAAALTEPTVAGDFILNATADKGLTIDGNKKVSDTGVEFTQRLKLNGTGSAQARNVSFTTTGAATLKVYAMSGSSSADRELLLMAADGVTQVGTAVVYGTVTDSIIPVATYEIPAAGTYYLWSAGSGINIYSIEVVPEGAATEVPERAAWSTVTAPVLGEPVVSAGKIEVPYTMLIGAATDGCDRLYIYMYDAAGNEVEKATIAVQSEGGVQEFAPAETGDYTFKAEAVRTDEEAVLTGNTVAANGYVLPLEVPTVASVTSQGNGKVKVTWLPVAETEKYVVSYRVAGSADAFTEAGRTAETVFVVEGLTTETKYEFAVAATRGAEVTANGTMSGTATAAAQQEWSFSAYGPSTSADSKNYYEGSVNEDGKVTVISKSNGGKWTSDADGVSFYYTAVSPDVNFKLSATATVDTWTFSNGQEGFGLMATDRVGVHGDSTSMWNNIFAAIVSKVEYWYDPEISEITENTGNKISMKLGVGSQQKLGVTHENIADGTIVSERKDKYLTEIQTFELSQALMAGTNTFNLVGNATNEVPGTLPDKAILTSFDFTIERNNTGYFISYDDPKTGKTVTHKYYDLDRTALTHLDSENVYVGFFTARNATVTFSDIQFTTSDPATDAPAEGMEIKYTSPICDVISGEESGMADHDLTLYTNCDGVITVKDKSKNVIVENIAAKADSYTYVDVTLTKGQNIYYISFTPDADFKFAEYHELSTKETQEFIHVIQHRTFDGKVIYVGKSVDSSNTGTGTKEKPTDLATAVKYVQPGQIILLEGGKYDARYLKKVTVERGTDGTAENPIFIIADPNATERPVLDFSQVNAGAGGSAIVIGGDYWILSGFDITGSPSGLKGMQISGSHCIVQDVNAYFNGDTGIQISRFKGTDYNEDWPSHNLILNCTSYNNADAGYENADGFGAKLTVGEGNVFDGCISYNNADDGWDLFAKAEHGPIGIVTLKNCVSFRNGVLLDGTIAGNGNGLKLGGESFTGYHKLINCIAFENMSKGIDSNSCPDATIYNSTSFNNGKYNVALYTNNALNTDFTADGVLSFRTEGMDVGETFKLLGTQDTAKVYGATNYYFDVASQTSKNSEGATADASWFKSLDTEIKITRNADGTINMNGLLELTDKAPAGVGAVIGGQANKDYSDVVLAAIAADENGTEVPAETPATGDKQNDADTDAKPFNFTIIIIVVVVAALAVEGFFLVRRFMKNKKSDK